MENNQVTSKATKTETKEEWPRMGILQNDLISACRAGKYDKVDSLLRSRANPNDWGMLQGAQRLKFDEFIEKGGTNRLEEAFKKQDRSETGQKVYPLHATVYAARRNTRNLGLIMRGRKGPTLDMLTTCVKVLLQAKADPNIRNKYRNTPIIFCRNVEIAKLLEAAGADFTAVNWRNCTPLHWAARDGNLAMTKFLTKNPLLQTAEYIEVHRLLYGCLVTKWPADVIKLIADFITTRFFLDARGSVFGDGRNLTALELAELKYPPLAAVGVFEPNFEAVREHLILTKQQLALVDTNNDRERLTASIMSGQKVLDLVSRVI